MLKHFLIAWLVYWGGVALLPVHSLYPGTAEALFLQATFVLLVAASASVTLAALEVPQMPPSGRTDIPLAEGLIWISIGLSVIGIAALIYDKLLIQGIDYADGFAAAREEWRRMGLEREDRASSIFSVIGYLVGSAYYVAVVLAITQKVVLSRRQRTLSLLACFVLLLANSVLTGGRSGILLIAPIMLGAFASRRGLSMRNLFVSKARQRLVKLLAVLMLSYTVFVFYQRAATGELEALEYALDFLPFLGVEVADWFRDLLDGGMLSSLAAMLVLAATYLVHSFATTAAILDSPPEDKTIMFLHISTIMYKLGLAAQPQGDWMLEGRLTSVPGALWYQFGTIGFIVGSLVLGFACALAQAWTAHRPHRLLPLGVYVLAEATLMLTPAVFAPDFLSFPFILGSFVMVSAIATFLAPTALGKRARHRKQLRLLQYAAAVGLPSRRSSA